MTASTEPQIPVAAALKALDTWTGERSAFGSAPDGTTVRMDITAARMGDATFRSNPAVRYQGTVRLSTNGSSSQTTTSIYLSRSDGLLLGLETSRDVRGEILEWNRVPDRAQAPAGGAYRRIGLSNAVGEHRGTQWETWALRTQGGRDRALLCVTTRVENPSGPVSAGPVETCAVTNAAGELLGFSGSASVPGVGLVTF